MAAPSYRRTLVTYLGPQRTKVGILATVLLATTGLELVVPLLLQRFIDGTLADEAQSVLVAAGVAYLVAGVAKQLFLGVTTYLGADVGWTATNRLREDLAKHLLGLDKELLCLGNFPRLMQRLRQRRPLGESLARISTFVREFHGL